jgi:hypothetical protein
VEDFMLDVAVYACRLRVDLFRSRDLYHQFIHPLAWFNAGPKNYQRIPEERITPKSKVRYNDGGLYALSDGDTFTGRLDGHHPLFNYCGIVRFWDLACFRRG